MFSVYNYQAFALLTQDRENDNTISYKDPPCLPAHPPVPQPWFLLSQDKISNQDEESHMAGNQLHEVLFCFLFRN